jgi:hypothetical protein
VSNKPRTNDSDDIYYKILLVLYKFVQRQERDVHISLNWIMTSRNVVNELSTLKRVDLSTEKNLAALNFGRLYVTTSIKT